MFNRRQFIIGASAAAGAAALPWWLNRAQANEPWLISAYSNKKKQHFAAAFNLQGDLISQVSLPARGHGAWAHPNKPGHGIIFARRPGTFMMEIDFSQGEIHHHIRSAKNHHSYGHGVFSQDGKILFTTENDFELGRGVIVLRDTENYQVIDSFDAGGLGPHECRLMPDGQTLVIANGGIKTHPNWPRKKLNIDTMVPSLTYLDLKTGQIIDQFKLDNHHLSIRHLDVSDQGKVIAGLQYQGQKTDQVPLAISHHGETSLQYLLASDKVWRSMNQYTASICINSQAELAAISCPRGDLVTFWDLRSNRFIDSIHLRDGAGLSLVDQHFVATNGKGMVNHQQQSDSFQMNTLKFNDIRWDNHLTTLQGV